MKSNKLTKAADILITVTGFIIFLLNYMEVRGVIFLDQKIKNIILLDDLDPIETITVGRSYCDNNKNYYPLINYTFYGVNKNCYDEENDKYLNKYPCPKNGNYSEIKEISTQKLSIWRNKNICIKRMANTKGKFYLVNKNKDCPANYTKCGLINSNNNNKSETNTKILCMSEKSENNTINKCPINFLTITNDIDKYDNNYTSLKLDSEYYLVYSNNMINEPIPMDFKISEGEYPCLESDRISYNYTPFPKLKNYKDYGCNRNYSKDNEGYDTRYTPFDTINKDYFFTDNYLDMDYRALPNIISYKENNKTIHWENDITNSNFSIFYRDFFLNKTNCSGYNDFSSSLKNIKKWQLIRVTISLLNVIFMTLFVAALSISKGISEITYSLFFLAKILICYLYFCLHVYFIKGVVLKKNSGYLDKIATFIADQDKDCLDDLTIISFERYNLNGDVKDTRKYYNADFIVTIIYAIFTSILTLRFVHKVWVRIKNERRRKIAYSEIGKEKLEEIFKEYRNKAKKLYNFK